MMRVVRKRMARRGGALISFSLLLLALAVPAELSGQAATTGSAFPYRVELRPARPSLGDDLELDLVVDGLSAKGMELVQLAADPSLSLESETIGPFVEPGGFRGAELRLVFRILRAGRFRIERLVLRAQEGSLTAGPFTIEAGGPLNAAGERERIWEWEAPEEIYRYQAFPVELRELGGADRGDASPAAGASFTVPEGASLEPSGPLQWTMVALDAGPLSLPEAEMSEGGRVLAKTPGRSIRVLPLPAAVESSRAVGQFELGLEGLDRAQPREGQSFVFRILLSGSGNLPVLRLPEPLLRLDGRSLPPGSVSSRRLDESRPARGGYEGRALLEVTVTPPRPGILLVSLPALAVLEPGTGIRQLSLEPVSLRVEAGPAGGRGSGTATDGGDAAFDAAPAIAAKLGANPALRRLGELLRLSRGGGGGALPARRTALGLLAKAGPGADRDYLEAALRWEGGERGRALAILYGTLRAHPSSGLARRAATLCSGELGSGPPLLDSLPPPLPFALGGTVMVLSGLALFLVARRRRGQVLGAAAGLLLLVAAALFAASAVSGAERRRPYAVVWTDRLLVVPSPLATGFVELQPGSAARVRGSSGDYVGLVLADGLAGWASRESVYYY